MDIDSWELVDESQVPPRPVTKTTSTKADAILLRLLSLEPGKYFKVPVPPSVDGKDKGKGIRISIGRVASTASIRIDTFEADGSIWVQRLPDEPVGEVVQETKPPKKAK